jgi:hypothetical protein
MSAEYGKQIDYSNPPEPVDRKNLFTARDLLTVVRSPKFSRSLSIAANYTQDQGHEAGFAVSVNPVKHAHIERVEAGGADSFQDSEPLEEIDGQASSYENLYLLFDFHFHPAADEVIEPSDLDVGIYGVEKPEKPPAFMAVGHVDDKGKIRMLITRKPDYRLTDEEIGYYDEDRRNASSQADIVNILHEIGIQTAVIDLKPKKAGGYSLPKTSLDEILKLDPITLSFT